MMLHELSTFGIHAIHANYHLMQKGWENKIWRDVSGKIFVHPLLFRKIQRSGSVKKFWGFELVLKCWKSMLASFCYETMTRFLVGFYMNLLPQNVVLSASLKMLFSVPHLLTAVSSLGGPALTSTYPHYLIPGNFLKWTTIFHRLRF